MPRGGTRKGAGRPQGALSAKTQEIARSAAAAGSTPLEYMLAVMRDEGADGSRRDDMAKAAAPFIHPRLSSTEVKSETTVRYVARVPEKKLTSDEWQQQHEQATTLQ